jgi:hypothetical protein
VDESAVGKNNGKINLIIDGGIPPYQVKWNNNSTENILEGLCAGVYSVLVADNVGAEKT